MFQKQKITIQSVIVILSASLLILPLFFWQRLYIVGFPGLALLMLAPLLWVLYSGFRDSLFEIFQARSTFELKSVSSVSSFNPAQIKATALSICYTLITLPVLALQALDAKPLVLATIIALCVISSGLTLKIPICLRKYMNEPYATAYGPAFSSAISALMFVPVLVIMNLFLVSSNCDQTSRQWLNELLRSFNPFNSELSWIAGFIEPFRLIGCTQQRLVDWIGEGLILVKLLYSFTLAMVAFIIAKASAAATIFIHDKFERLYP